MKRFLILLSLSLAYPAAAEKLSYLARDKVTGAALVEHDRGRQNVQEGDQVSGWGRVKSIEDDVLRLERVLDEAEREAMRKKGQLPVQAEEIIVPRRDSRVIPVARR